MAVKYGMLINLSKCVGCGACALACKTENNTEYQQGGTKYNWADFLTFTTGTFAGGDVKFEARPVLCNHCSSPACVPACDAAGHYAITKVNGITMIDESKCVGCQECQDACPYSSKDVVTDDKQYSVLHYNPATPSPQSFWAGTTAMISSGTSTPAEVATAAVMTPPYKNAYTGQTYSAVRPANVVEKCYFCNHRVESGDLPYCVESCPAGARVFGDLNDSTSYISTLIASNPYKRLKNNDGDWLSSIQTGTDPSVYYIGDYNDVTVSIKEVKDLTILRLSLYPNPTSSVATIEFDLKNNSPVNVTIYDVMGREIKRVIQNENKPAGKQKIEINVSDLSSGKYICTVMTDHDVMSANFVVNK